MRSAERVAIIAVAVVATLVTACGRPASANEEAAHAAVTSHPAGYIVDSILPPGEAMRRFRVGLDSPATLNGPTSRDELVRDFMAALRKKDRPALSALAMDRAEFAYLVFPASKWSRPPYNQPPDVAWLLSQAKSSGSLTKLLHRADGYETFGYRCSGSPELDGALTLWAGCHVHVREGAQHREMRLFGTIVERNGRFKFASFDNDF